MTAAARTLLALLLFAAPAFAADDLDRAVLESQAWRRGDYEGLFDEWISIMRAHPEAPQVEVCQRAWKNVEEFVPDPTRYLPRLRELEETVHGANAFWLRENVARLLEETGDYDEADKVRERDGDLRHWRIAGPFGRASRACYDVAYPPERGIAAAWKTYPGVSKVAPFRYLRPVRGAAYALCQVHSDAEGEATLWLHSEGSVRVWWNGAALPDANHFRCWLPSTLCVRVHLSAGWNQVMVKCLSDASPFRVRLLGADNEPMRLAEEEGVEDHPVVSKAPNAVWSSWGGLAAYEQAGGAGTETAWAASLKGFLLSEETVYDRALAAELRAAELEPKSAHIACLLGEVYHMSLHLPEGERRNRAKDAYDKALSLDPKFVPAMEDLAIHYRLDHQPEKALAILLRASDVNPKHFAGPALSAGMLTEEGWGIEGRHALEELERRAPGNLQTQDGLAAEEVALGNYPHARKLLSALAPKSASARRALTALAKSTGDLEGAVAEARARAMRYPADPEAQAELGAALEDQGKLEEAIAAFRKAVTLVPGNADYTRRIGQALIREGHDEEGIAALAQALAIDPTDTEARELLSELRGESEDVPEPYRVDADEAIGRAGPASRAPVDYLLRETVVRVRRDGSSTLWTHQILRLNSSEAIDKYQTSNVQGTVLAARTITPDGRVLMPSQITDQGAITFPGLIEGSIIETRYRGDLASSSEGFSGSFFFHDQARDGPVRLARLVIEWPKGMPLEIRERNFGRKGEVTRSDGHPPMGWLAAVWEAKELSMLERQSKSPPDEDLLPWVLVAEKVGWCDVVEAIREEIVGATRVTEEIRRAAADAAKGCGTDRAKAEAVYHFAQKWIQEGNGGKGAQEILSTRHGSILLLASAMLDALGVRHEWVSVRPRAELSGDAVWEVPRAEIFSAEGSSLLIRVPLADGAMWLSGDARFLAPGQLPEVTQGGAALVLDPDQPRFLTVPTAAAEAFGNYMTMEAALSSEGALAGKMRFEVRGVAAAGFKDRLLGIEAPQRKMVFQTLLGKFFLGFQLQEMLLPDLEAPGTPLEVEVSFQTPSYAQARDGHMTVRGPYPASRLRNAYCHERERTVPMRLAAWEVSQMDAHVRLPEGWRVTKLPEDTVIQGDIGRISITWRIEGDAVRVRHEVEIPPQALTPERYADLVKFCTEGDAAEEQVMELAK